MNLNDLKKLVPLINQLECPETDCAGNGEIRIAILQRGWIVVGRFAQSGDMCEITNGHVIRVWGTSNGLGEIAENGPTTSTKLDKITNCQFHILTVVAFMDCNERKWHEYIK